MNRDPSWKDYHNHKPLTRRFNDGPPRHHQPPPSTDANHYVSRGSGNYRDEARSEPPVRAPPPPPRDYRPETDAPPYARDVRDARDLRDTRDARDARDARDVREARDYRPPPRDSRPLSPPPGSRGYSRDYDDYRGPVSSRGPPGPPPPPPLSTGAYDSRPYERAPYEARPPPIYASEYDRVPPLPPRDYGPSSAPAVTGPPYDRAYGGLGYAGNGRTRSPVPYDS